MWSVRVKSLSLDYYQGSKKIDYRCEYGWFGYPREEGGKCEPCHCNKFGIVSDECDEETGQCNCMPNITGRDCSVCQANHILTNKGCTRKLMAYLLQPKKKKMLIWFIFFFFFTN